ncbi:hypothetical protein BDW67DRAFT_13108 [Aspergillus spinulosporus]
MHGIPSLPPWMGSHGFLTLYLIGLILLHMTILYLANLFGNKEIQYRSTILPSLVNI